MKKIYCRNEDDIQVEFSYDENAEYFLVSVDGIMSVNNKVATSENTMTDGSTYQGSTTKQRNIVITASIDGDYQKRRDLLYKCFKPKMTGVFTYYEDDEIRQIDYKVERIEIDEKGVVRNAVISLLCPDPLFRDREETTITMSGWNPNFEFIHEFKDEKEEFGARINELVKVIENESAADYIGITIEVEAMGTVINPTIYHQEQDIFVKIGTSGHALTLNAGERIRITTGTNNKNVYLIDTADQETKINEYLDEGSDFIQLIHGRNTFIYAADAGTEYMDVTISYQFRYLGV